MIDEERLQYVDSIVLGLNDALVELTGALAGFTLTLADTRIIYGFNYYLSVAKDLDFKARFTEMAVISLGMAAFSFIVGYGLKFVLGVD